MDCPWWVCSLEAGFTVQCRQLLWMCCCWKGQIILWWSDWHWQDWSCGWWVDAKPVGKKIKLPLEKPSWWLPLRGLLLCWILAVFLSVHEFPLVAWNRSSAGNKYMSCSRQSIYWPGFCLFSFFVSNINLIPVFILCSFLLISIYLLYAFFSNPLLVWGLAATAPCADPAQHSDGESRRRLDGSGRIPGQKRSV